jgi:predicted amino acid racemase
MPVLHIDVEAIGLNTEKVAALLRACRRGPGAHALELVAVTKGCLGEPRIGATMLAGGATALADTRDYNLRRLRAALPQVELHRIHLPSFAEQFQPGDITYVSSWQGAQAVAAVGEGRRRVIVQVETGDEREGVPMDELPALADRISSHPDLELAGVSTNYACFKGKAEGIHASVEALAQAAAALRDHGHTVERVSGGNSSLLGLLAAGERLPAEVTELRCGEGLLLGQDALHYRPLPGCRTDACLLRAEVVEEYTKRAAGRLVRRVVLGVGRQDLSTGTVRFVEPGFSEVGRSADYLVLEAGPEWAAVSVGAMIDMIPSYEALVAAWTSPYVDLRFQGL